MLTVLISLFCGLVSVSLALIFGTQNKAKYLLEKYNSSSSNFDFKNLDLGNLFSTIKKIRNLERERSLPDEDIPIYDTMKRTYRVVIFCTAASFILWIYIVIQIFSNF